MSKIVVAIGGNALGETPTEQKQVSEQVAGPLVDLVAAGHQVIIAHGNGPQVGFIQSAFSLAAERIGDQAKMPLCECVAMTQGYIGYHLQNALRNELAARGFATQVGSVVCQAVVDAHDPAFQKPEKPVGAYLSEEEAARLRALGHVVMEDAGRGFRRAVPSPDPIGLVEDWLIKSLADTDSLLIVGGGGGIPVVDRNGRYEGVDAVVDKDKSAELIAELINADCFLLLTAVEKVAIHFGTPQQTWLEEVAIQEMENFLNEGHFAPGSMRPKVEAALRFAKSKPGRTAFITSLQKAGDSLDGRTGTRVIDRRQRDSDLAPQYIPLAPPRTGIAR
jgi:carbamate kinase